MKNEISNLNRTNLIVASIAGLFFFVFVATLWELNYKTLLLALGVVVDFLIIGFINILLLQVQFFKKWAGKYQLLGNFVVATMLGLAWLLLTASLRTSIIGWGDKAKMLSPDSVFFLLTKSAVGNICIILVYKFIFLQQEKLKMANENTKLRLVNIEAANQLLKQQIQPHFLFNALNTLKGLYKTNPSLAEEYLIHLADFLRASISYTDKKLVEISEEIKLCNNYMKMQSVRFGPALVYSFEATLTVEKGYIPSFSLQPLLENAIKHNDVTDSAPLRVKVYAKDGYLVVENNLQPKKGLVGSTGKGLINLVERYKLLSGDDVVIEDSGESFLVAIKILEK